MRHHVTFASTIEIAESEQPVGEEVAKQVVAAPNLRGTEFRLVDSPTTLVTSPVRSRSFSAKSEPA